MATLEDDYDYSSDSPEEFWAKHGKVKNNPATTEESNCGTQENNFSIYDWPF